MKRLSDWIIVGGLSCGIGICGVSIAGAGGITGIVGVGVLGSTTGAIIGASVVRSRRILEELYRSIEALKIERDALEGQISGLKSQVESLDSKRLELNSIQQERIREIVDIRGEYGRKQAELEYWQASLHYS